MKVPALGELTTGERCLVHRRRRGMTQAEAAALFGCSTYWVRQMEQGLVSAEKLEAFWCAL